MKVLEKAKKSRPGSVAPLQSEEPSCISAPSQRMVKHSTFIVKILFIYELL